MKTEYKYIYFSKQARRPGRKTDIWNCYNKTHETRLGILKWYGAWRQYVFYPEADMLFNVGCLSDIIHFIEQLRKRAHKPKQTGKGEEDELY